MLNTSPKANYTLILGRKFYEFTNHLGNVLTVFTDLKIPQDTDNNNVVDNYKIGIVRTADYSPFGVALDGRTKDYEIPIVTNGTPGVIYQHKFDDSPNAHPYTGTPSNLDPNLTQVSWTNSLNAWTNYTGHTGRAIAITNTVQDTARLYLNMTINSGNLLDVISYSFRHRSSPTGYANYNIYINNIFVGSGSIFVSSSTTLQTTGTVNVANAIAGISGTVTVRLDLYNRVGPLTQGTFRMDDFVLNGYTTAVENWRPMGYRYGFNNKEKDDEVKGSGNSYDFGARMYDSRVGRWLTIDPLAEKYRELSPFNFVANSTLLLIDSDGKEIVIKDPVTGTQFIYRPNEEVPKEATQFVIDAFMGLDYLYVNGVENGINRIDDLVKSKDKFNVIESSRSRFEASYSSEHDLFWDNSSAFEMEKGYGFQSPIVGFAHELDHAFRFLKASEKFYSYTGGDQKTEDLLWRNLAVFYPDRTYPGDPERLIEENITTKGYETFIAEKLNEGVRPDYSVIPIKRYLAESIFSIKEMPMNNLPINPVETIKVNKSEKQLLIKNN